MSNTEAVEREKEIPRQMADIQEALKRLDDASCVLRDKLHPVLKADLISPEDTGTKNEERALVPLAADLRLICRRVNNILSTIKYLNEACEL